MHSRGLWRLVIAPTSPDTFLNAKRESEQDKGDFLLETNFGQRVTMQKEGIGRRTPKESK